MSARKRLSLEKPYNYFFNAKEPPKLRVQIGEEFEIETEDASSGSTKMPEDAEKIGKGDMWNHRPPLANPISGPVYIEGVERGDVVIVEILDIIPAEYGFTSKIEGFGQLTHDARFPKCHGSSVRPIRHLPGPSGTTSDGKAQMQRDDPSKPPFEWDLEPFFGTIGLSPEFEVISSLLGPYTASKGGNGGNWDARDIKKGSKIWLQALCPGGLFMVGDMHGSQGDGEWGGVADETAGLGVFKCEVLKNKTISYARIEKRNSIIQMNSGRPLERALDEATIWLMQWLIHDYDFDERECYDFLAVCPDFRYNIYQSVPQDCYTVGAEISKRYLPTEK